MASGHCLNIYVVLAVDYAVVRSMVPLVLTYWSSVSTET